VRSVLVDTGPLIALFNVRAKLHERFKASVLELSSERIPLVTTWPCVTEATHLLDRLDNRLRLLAWLVDGAALVREFPASELARMGRWMRRYSVRREMDFADASLVWLAGELDSSEILTTDRRDFERYRTPAGKPFRLL
jgi:predicted nucleic acid-binding protein